MTSHHALKLLRDVFECTPPDIKITNQAIDSECDDFEDAIQFHSAIRVSAHALITHNPNDFPSTTLTIATPDEFLKLWANHQS